MQVHEKCLINKMLVENRVTSSRATQQGMKVTLETQLFFLKNRILGWLDSSDTDGKISFSLNTNGNPTIATDNDSATSLFYPWIIQSKKRYWLHLYVKEMTET